MLDEVEKLNWKSWGVARVMISWNSDFFDDSLTSLETRSAAFWRDDDKWRKRSVIRQQKGVINERQSNCRSLMFQFETHSMLFTTSCRAWKWDGERKRNFSLRDKISYLTNEKSSSSTQTDFIRDHRRLLRYPFSAIHFVLLTLRCGSVFGGFGQARLSPALFST